MAKDATELLYSGDGEMYLAPVGTALPTTTSTALNAAFKGLGFTNPDGVTIEPSVDFNTVPAWQSEYDIDRRITGRALTISLALYQVNDRVIQANFGGGTWTGTGTGADPWKYTPPAAGAAIDYRAAVVEWIDGAIITRWAFPKVLLTSPGQIQSRRSDPAEVQIGFDVMYTGVGDPFNVLTTAAGFNPATG